MSSLKGMILLVDGNLNRSKEFLLREVLSLCPMSIDVRTSEWNSLISGKKLVAADFWAEWCPYCVRLKPIFESAAKDYQDIKFVKVNVQAEPDIASRYGIRGIPVIKFFCEGKEVGEIVGFVPENVLKNRIEEISKNAPSCLSNTSIR